MKIKEEFLEHFITNPFTNKMVSTTLLDPELYEHFYNAGYDWLFDLELNTDKKIIENYKIEIEIEKDTE